MAAPLSSSSNCTATSEALSAALNSVALNTKSASETAARVAAASDPSFHRQASPNHHDSNTHFPQFFSPISPSNNSVTDVNQTPTLQPSTTNVMWFRNDLRIHDNEALFRANAESSFLVPIYCFDPRDFGKSPSMGLDKTGPYRALFIIECVANLRENLRKRGSDLVVRIGKPEDEVVDIAKAVGASSVYVHQEVSHEEFEMEKTVAESLEKVGVAVKLLWGGTLFHKDDLPFELADMPSSYCTFRAILRKVQVRPVLEAPDELKSLPELSNMHVGEVPTLEDLGLSCGQDGDATKEEPTTHGGETEALRIIRSIDALLIDSKDKEAHHSVETPSGINPAWNVSPWLAIGCLSPRQMLQELTEKYSRAGVRVFEEGFEHHVLDSLLMELLWRDFFRFVTRKYVSQ